MHYLKSRNIAVFAVVFLCLFALSTYLLATLSGVKNMACVEAAYFTGLNIFINLLISVMVGLSVVNTLELRNTAKYSASSSLLGSVLLFLTSFCASCSLPFIAALGVGSLVNFISFNHSWFQLIAVGLCLYGFLDSHKKVTKQCRVCQL